MDMGSVIFGIDIRNPFSYSCFHAGVVKLVDARDSKSREPQAHVGSIPTSGTIHFNRVGVFKERFSQGFAKGFGLFGYSIIDIDRTFRFFLINRTPSLRNQIVL
jgi:hypothetical protein